MKKVKNRAYSALLLAVLIIAGMGLYVYRYTSHGEDWAAFTASSQIVTNEGKMRSYTLSGNHESTFRSSLLVQWIRIHRLPVQETRVQSLVREDPTGRRATEPVRHSY